MKLQKSSTPVFIMTFLLICTFQIGEAQGKKLKRPKNTVGVSSVDHFVRNSFDIYDKVYTYDGYAQNGTPLSDEDLDVLEDAMDDMTALSESAPNIIDDLDGVGILKQGKATLNMNKAKKALKYSITTTKRLLTEHQKRQPEAEDTSPAPPSDNSPKSSEAPANSSHNTETASLEIYKKFDFVPGDTVLFFDDFSQDFIGDFPSKWNTNGSGEVAKLSGAKSGNWFEMVQGHNIFYIPMLNEVLPEDYTIEFDLMAHHLTGKTSSAAKLYILISDNNGFHIGEHYTRVSIPFGQYTAMNINMDNSNEGSARINSSLNSDIRTVINGTAHISIAVNKNRYRLWINEKKYLDIPQFVHNPELIKHFKLGYYNTNEAEEQIFIKNIKIAEGGVDLRRTLINTGKVSTNGILFNSGSAVIQPQSYGIIRQISTLR